MANACDTCTHYEAGRCLRYPPQATDNPADLWQQPRVKPEDRCGEWQWAKKASALKGGKK